MAWDRRLLSNSQHFTLLIYGMRGVYPTIQTDGFYARNAVASDAQLKFRVGLTPRYKPGKDQAREVTRHFALVEDGDDEADKGEDFIGEDVEMSDIIPDPPVEDEDFGRFEKFSLSSPLESLLNEVFVRVLQLRIKFKLGWAAAETLQSEIEKTQRKPEDIYQGMQEVNIELLPRFDRILTPPALRVSQRQTRKSVNLEDHTNFHTIRWPCMRAGLTSISLC
jgi:ubiquitin-conjugating enzyme E2 Q